MRLTFVTVDVFTDRQFGGNPLAVVIDADGLSSRQMQAIAAEFNLAETTFVLPPQDAAHTAQVRIFTPRAEMPFAGHPNVGTAFVLAREGQCHGRPVGGEAMVFEEAAGLVRMELVKQGATVIGASLAAPQRLAVGDTVAPEIVAQACASRLRTSRHATISLASRAAARPCSLSNSRVAKRLRRRSRAPMSSLGICRGIASPAFTSMSRRLTAALTSNAACSRRCTASPRIPRPELPMSP